MLPFSDILSRMSCGLDLRGSLLLDYGRTAEEPGASVRTVLPIYGIGALGIYAMKPMKKHPAWLVFYYLIEPAAERTVSKADSKTVHTVCLLLLLVFIADCILSALFRTPITY